MLSNHSNGSIASFILNGENPKNEHIFQKIKLILNTRHELTPKTVNADIFTYCGKTLVIAYRTPPLRRRIGDDAVRLRRI